MDLYRAKEKGCDTWLYGSVLQISDEEMYMLLAGPVVSERPAYNALGIGCGLEDKNITDRYEAAAFGWEEACERFEECCPTFVVCDPETVCRSTGLCLQAPKSKAEDLVPVFEGDIIGVTDKQGTVVGIVRFGEYEMPTDTEKTHLGFYIEWQDDGANKWSEWWRQDFLFWLRERKESCKLLGNIYDDLGLMPAGEEAGQWADQPLLMPAT